MNAPLNRSANIPTSTQPSSPALTLSKVTCAYHTDRPAIHDVSLHAHQGDILCLLGPSGCGKTTTLRAIAGFEPIVSGEIFLNHTLVSSVSHHVSPEHRRIGMVFQDYALFPHLRIADNIAFGLTTWSSGDRVTRIREMLSMVGMEGYDRRFPHELSGGQQQRVALARALAPKPVILLLDEPFSNLDPDMTYRMREELHQLLKETHTTTVLVTHDHEEAFTMGDHIAVLHEGNLAQFDSPEIIYHQPASPFIAEFVGQADFLPGTVQEGCVQTEIGPFPLTNQYQGPTEVMVMIRPDDIQIASSGEGNAHIEARLFRGAENLYTIRLATGQVVHCHGASTLLYSPGTPVTLTVTATHTVLFARHSPEK